MSPIKISNSEIQTYKDCKRKWWLTYYRELGLVVEDLTGARKLGTNVHTVLGDWYKDGADPVNGIITIYAEQIKAVEAAGQDAAKLRKDADLTLAMVEGYLQWVDETGQDIDLELVGTEQVIEYPIEVVGHEVLLRGKLDARFDPPEQVRANRQEAGRGQLIADAAHHRVHAEDLLDDHYGRRLRIARSRHVSGELAVVGLDGGGLTHR